MTRTWLILIVLTLCSLGAAFARWEGGVIAACVVMALSWLKLRLVMTHFVGIHGGWSTGLSTLFAVFLGLLVLPYTLG